MFSSYQCWALRFLSITPTSNRGASKAIGHPLTRQTLPAQPATSPRAARTQSCATSITSSASATVRPPQRVEPSVYNYHHRIWGISSTIRTILLAPKAQYISIQSIGSTSCISQNSSEHSSQQPPTSCTAKALSPFGTHGAHPHRSYETVRHGTAPCSDWRQAAARFKTDTGHRRRDEQYLIT